LDPILDWVLPLAAVFLAAALPIVFDATPATWPEKFKDPWIYVFGGLGVSTVVLTILQAVLSQTHRSSAQRGLSHFSHALGDTVAAVRELVESDGTHVDRQRFLESMASEAKSLVPLDTPRICVYVLEAPDDEDGHDYLKYVTHKGRIDQPRPLFLPTDNHGQDAIAVAKGNTHRCVDDSNKLSAGPIHVQRDADAMWRSFIIMPLRANNKPWGALMIDTVKQTHFTQDQIAVCQAVARFIELGLRRVEEASDDTGPEVLAAIAAFKSERGEPRHVGTSDADTLGTPGEEANDGQRA
jgi:GAF domain-containing protein